MREYRPVPEVVQSEACPDCGTTMPVAPGYVTWCDACGWNLSAPAVAPATGPFARLGARAGRHFGERALARVLERESLEPRPTVGRVAAYALAAVVHLGTLTLLVGGVLLAVLAFPNPFGFFAAGLALLLATIMRPRLGRPPRSGVVDRASAPTLYHLADRVAAAIGTDPADVIAVSPAFNAYWSVVGLRRTRVLTLGLPLLAALGPQERVALIGHELAHGSNGDSGRGLFVGSALDALATVLDAMSLRRGLADENIIWDTLAGSLLWLVSRPAYLLLLLEFHLLQQDGQRAEYLADLRAAQVAGTDAEIRVEETLLLGPTVRALI